MATPSRRSDTPLAERLADDPSRYGFAQAVRLLQLLEPNRVPVGWDGPLARETVRFRAEQSLSFPPTEILELEATEDEKPPEMTVRFMGLTGPMGALPRHYTELVIARLRRKDQTLAAFLDLFNHRLVSFFYRAWEKYRPHLLWDPELRGDFAGGIFSLFGLGTRGLRDRLEIQDRALLHYAGLLAQRPHSAVGLESMLEDYFGGLPTRVVQFVGQWLPLESESLTRMGSPGMNTQLGVDAVIGSKVWHTQSRFRVRFGPMGYAQFCDFLPAGTASFAALELSRFYVGEELDFEFQLVLRAAEVPSIQLGRQDTGATRLGWSTWLKSGEFSRDADDVVLDAAMLTTHRRHVREDQA